MWIWLEFLLVAALIVAAGARLSRYGEGIARVTGLSGGWIGMALLASVTSLPELVAGVSAVTVADAPDIAVGNVLGACALNFAMIAVLDGMHRSASIYHVASQGHALGAAFAALMLGLVGFALVTPPDAGMRLGHVGLATPLLFVLYVVAMRTLYQYESRAGAPGAAPPAAEHPLDLRALVWRYAAASVVVVAAAVRLPFAAANVAQSMAWTQGFVGTLLVALVTTLPELAVTIAAVRLGALDLAIGNLVGSNLFNLVVLGIDDLFYAPGSLYSAVAPTHAVSVVTGTMMSGAVIVALIARPQARLLNLVGWTSVVLALLFFANAWIHFRQPAGG
jgi:cation:H+ antiporter